MKLAYLLIIGIAAGSIVGVDPQDAHLYKPIVQNGKKLWRCLSDPSIVLNYDQVNDDYCDCPDGSDEPGTNACATHPKQFYCANEGHFPGYIDHFKVNDGLCDYDVCCDGSDETFFKDGKQCPNRCLEISEQFQNYKTHSVNNLKKSLAIKHQLELDSLKMRLELEEAVEFVAREIEAQEAILGELQKKQEERAEAGEEGQEEQAALVYEVFEPIIMKLSKAIEYEKHERDKVSKLEGVLSKLISNYNPNFNDAAVKEAVRTYQDYVSNDEEKLVGRALSPQEAEEVVYLANLYAQSRQEGKGDKDTRAPLEDAHVGAQPTFSNMLHYYYETFLSKFLDAPKEEPVQKRQQITLKKSAGLGSTLGQEIEVAEHEITDSKKRKALLEKDLNVNYGPSDILRSVKSQWVRNKVGEYQYNFGFFDSIYQEGNGNNVLIGSFSTIEEGQVLVYNRGAKCWNGPSRSARVKLVCGEEPKLLSVSEPEKCEYYFELQTPIVCQELTEEDLIRGFKVDYSQL